MFINSVPLPIMITTRKTIILFYHNNIMLQIAIVIIVILFFIIIKYKFNFWSYQPVFHFYDLHYWFNSIGIKNHDLPIKNKYYNSCIDTINFATLRKSKLRQYLKLIQTNYLQNKENKFYPLTKNIMPYFMSHNFPCFISFYIELDKIVGSITTRPLHASINNGNNAEFDVYYVDYLCVDLKHRKMGIAPQLIQTHEYNQRHLNQKISVSLFKREGDLTGIVPLCFYKTYCFDMLGWCQPTPFPTKQLVKCDAQNIYVLRDFINDNPFSINIFPEYSNLLTLIETKNIHAYILLENSEIISAYFFRKTCVFIKKNMEVLSCFASINATLLKTFTHGFKLALSAVVRSHTFHYLAIENISHNNYIIDNIKLKTHPFIESPTAYFFYNFIYSTFESNKVLIIN